MLSSKIKGKRNTVRGCVEGYFWWSTVKNFLGRPTVVGDIYTAWKVSKYGVFSAPYFLAFGLNTEKYEISLHIQSECGKIRTTKNFVFAHFSRSVKISFAVIFVTKTHESFLKS